MVILASDFECVQIIPGAQNGNIQVGCVECSHQLGRVSVDDALRHTPTLNSYWLFARLDGVMVYPVHEVELALHFAAVSSRPCFSPWHPAPPLPACPFSFGNGCVVTLMGVSNGGMMNTAFLFLDRRILWKHSLHL